MTTGGASQASFTLDGGSPQSESAKKCEGEVGWVCKTCRLVFPSLPILTLHQKMLQHLKGTLKLTQLLYSCTQCKSTSTTALEYRWHLEGDMHKKSQGEIGENQDSDVTDVVRQITALTEAAQAEASTKQPSNDEERVSDGAESIHEIEKTSTSLSSLNVDKVKTMEQPEQKAGRKDNSKLNTNTPSHSNSKEMPLNQENSNDMEGHNNAVENMSESTDGRCGSHRSYGDSTVASQETVSSYNDYGYAEHSISFVSNPNYTPSYSYQTCNSYGKVSPDQSVNLATLYNSYQDNMQLQNYYTQTCQYQSVSHSSQSYNCFSRMSEFQHSTPTYCSPTVINQPLTEGDSTKELSFFPGHTLQKRDTSFPNFDAFQSGYPRPGDSMNAPNPNQVQGNYMTNSMSNFRIESTTPAIEPPFLEPSREEEINRNYKEQYHQYGVPNDSSRFDYSQETPIIEKKESQETDKNANINKNVSSTAKV